MILPSAAEIFGSCKPTSRVPLGCSSPTALNLMMTFWLGLSSTSISSSSSMAARKACVGSASVYLQAAQWGLHAGARTFE